jgi:hypothetical protein
VIRQLPAATPEAPGSNEAVTSAAVGEPLKLPLTDVMVLALEDALHSSCTLATSKLRPLIATTVEALGTNEAGTTLSIAGGLPVVTVTPLLSTPTLPSGLTKMTL